MDTVVITVFALFLLWLQCNQIQPTALTFITQHSIYKTGYNYAYRCTFYINSSYDYCVIEYTQSH